MGSDRCSHSPLQANTIEKQVKIDAELKEETDAVAEQQRAIEETARKAAEEKQALEEARRAAQQAKVCPIQLMTHHHPSLCDRQSDRLFTLRTYPNHTSLTKRPVSWMLPRSPNSLPRPTNSTSPTHQ